MLSLNCLLADITNKIRIAEKYGQCDDKIKYLQKYLASYQWLYNNAWSCLTDCQRTHIETFIKRYFNGVSFTDCTAEINECADTPAPINDDCSGARFVSYPTSASPTIEISNLTNGYTCNVQDYPSDSGLTTPSSWDVDSSGDIWYRINTGASIVLNPYITIVGVTMTYPQLAIYEGTCAGLTFIAEADNITESSNYMQASLQASSTYYIRVSNAGGNNNTGTFNMVISLFPII